jgi:hypothetical protein
MRDITIDYDAAESITISTISNHQKFLAAELDACKEEKLYLHPDDVIRNERLIEAMDFLLKNYFGCR